MKNRSLLTTSLCAVTVMAAFCSHAASNNFQSGFYASGKGGTEELRATMDVNTSIESVELTVFDIGTNLSQDAVPLYKNYAVGNLALGYNMVGLFSDRLLLGVELSGNISGREEVSLHEAETTDLAVGGTFPLSHTSLVSEYEVALIDPDLNTDLRLGFLIAPNFLVYARAGAAFNKVEKETELTYSITDLIGFTDTVTINDSDTDSIVGFRGGLGVEYKVSEWFGVNMDYIYTNYGTVKQSATETNSLIAVGGDELFPTTVDTESETELSKQTVLVGATVYFGGKKAAPVYMEVDK